MKSMRQPGAEREGTHGPRLVIADRDSRLTNAARDRSSEKAALLILESQRSWLGLIKPILQHDKVRRLALGALSPIAFLFEAPVGYFPCRLRDPAKIKVQTNTCDPDQSERLSRPFPLPSQRMGDH